MSSRDDSFHRSSVHARAECSPLKGTLNNFVLTLALVFTATGVASGQSEPRASAARLAPELPDPTPRELPRGISCDADAAFGRGVDGGQLYISCDRGPGEQRYTIDNYPGFSGSITRVRWWGNSTLAWLGPDCAFDQPTQFVIRFYNSTGSPPTPVYARPLYTFHVGAVYQDTGIYWMGYPEYGSIECYDALLDEPCAPGPGSKWISIASVATGCDFLWAPATFDASDFGQWYYQDGVAIPEAALGHRSFCLYTTVTLGACCRAAGDCADDQQPAACSASAGTFYPELTCAEVPGGCSQSQASQACCFETSACADLSLPDCSAIGGAARGVGTTCAQAPCILLGDLNCDRAVNTFDIDPFVLALVAPQDYASAYPGCDLMAADANRDGNVDLFDIDPFVLLLTAGDSPSRPSLPTTHDRQARP